MADEKKLSREALAIVATGKQIQSTVYILVVFLSGIALLMIFGITEPGFKKVVTTLALIGVGLYGYYRKMESDAEYIKAMDELEGQS